MSTGRPRASFGLIVSANYPTEEEFGTRLAEHREQPGEDAADGDVGPEVGVQRVAGQQHRRPLAAEPLLDHPAQAWHLWAQEE